MMRGIFLLILLAASGTVLGQGAHYTYPFSLTCPEGVAVAGEKVEIGVTFPGGHTGELYRPSYSWTVSNGTIVGGQGTTKLELQVDSSEPDQVTVVLTRDFLQAHFPGVEKEASCRIVIVPRPAARMTDEFRTRGDNCEDGLARLDSFLTELQNDPNSNGVIVLYGDTAAKRAARIRKTQLGRWVSIRRFDPSRLRFVIGAPRESGTTQFWIVPPGAEPPVVEEQPEVVEPRPALPYLHSAFFLDGLPECSPYSNDIADYARVLNLEPRARARIVIAQTSRAQFARELKEITAELVKNGVSRSRIVGIYKRVRPNRLEESRTLWVIPGRGH